MKKHVQINLGESEVKLLKDFFVSKWRTPEIKSTHFEQLVNTAFKRQFDQKAAKESLNDLKNRFD